MSNLILLCHSGLAEFSSFDLKGEQTLVYRGNYGAPLGDPESIQLVTALLSDPYVTDKQIKAAIPNYQGDQEITGPVTTKDWNIAGDNPQGLFCALIDMTSRRAAVLGKNDRFKLSWLVGQLGGPFWLNLVG